MHQIDCVIFLQLNIWISLPTQIMFQTQIITFLLPYLSWYKFKHMFQQKGLQESAGFFPIVLANPFQNERHFDIPANAQCL